MATAFSSGFRSGSKFSMAVMPWGTVRVGSTMTLRSASFCACSDAMMMFLLLGRTSTVLAGTLWMAARMSSVEGFIVWPPLTTASTPRSLKTAFRPSPAATATKPYSRSGSTAA